MTNQVAEQPFDVVVIGAGPGGHVAEIRAAARPGGEPGPAPTVTTATHHPQHSRRTTDAGPTYLPFS
ncbi:hypothetical protein [Streptosporangium sp. NPDC051022]|uniref:hypothetical protein n=1 Tax=Streptosporangium sp. NPDC051022 TaxID=3155752 RepID=UPI0034175CF4